MSLNHKYRNILFFVLTVVVGFSCKKLTQVPEPVNTVTTEEAFNSDATASAAIAGIYNYLITATSVNGFAFSNGATTIYAGMSSDELNIFNGTSVYQTNTYNASSISAGQLWNAPYYAIYLANAAINALPVSTGVSISAKKQLIGEAKFFRAFSYFYLVNLFGDVPLATTTAYAITDTLSRAPSSKVYEQMVADLKDAQNSLTVDYSVSNGERIRVNQAGATALLARVYLYQQKWDSAEMAASAVINNTGLYALSDLNSVFLANSTEAILQLAPPNKAPYVTTEGNKILPPTPTGHPSYYLTTQLLGAFEAGDKRRTTWVDSVKYQNKLYYYPYKYKVYQGTLNNITEYYMLLRLGEQFLIRAEARAQQNNLDGAIADLDSLRERAGLPDLSPSLAQQDVLAAVAQERRIELLAEWGHRWLDLKRTGQVDAVLGPIKAPNWKTTAQLYPIPATELVNDANLDQNTGY